MRDRPLGPGVDVLVLAAHPLELTPFEAVLGDALAAELHGMRVAAADVGVGLPAAGAGSARRLLEHAPRTALLVGSYGCYPSALALMPGRVLVPGRVRAIDAAQLAGRAAFPPAMSDAIETDAALSDALAACGEGVLRGELATTLGITTDDALARELAQRSGCDAENMEALAVGLACRAAGVAFAAVLGCTNQVGAQGRAQWLQHRELAARATTELVLRWLSAQSR